mgnify:CR=1 FL=1
MDAQDKIRIDQLESKIDKLNVLILQHNELLKIHTEHFKEVLSSLESNLECDKVRDKSISELKSRFDKHVNENYAHEI